MLVDNRIREDAAAAREQFLREDTQPQSRLAHVELAPPKARQVAPNEDVERPEKPPSFLVHAQQKMERLPVAVIAITMGLITLIIHGYRVNVAPDVFSDEGLYLQVGISLARGYGLVVNHQVFLWHPPVYMLLEAAYIRLTGLTYADPLTTLLAVRNVNIFFSALTAMLIVLFGRKLHSRTVGVVAATIFILDPYVQRINRRNMLETVVIFFVLLGLYLFFTRQPRLTKWQCIGSGIAFGLALLTKEVVLPEIFVLVAYTIFFNRGQIRDLIWVCAIASLFYLIYPLAMIASGQGDAYLTFKFFGVTRVISLVSGQQAAPPKGTYLPAANKVSLLHTVVARLAPYGTSYLLIGCGAAFTLVLLIHFKGVMSARYLLVWCVFSLAFGSVLINISDQYAYFLVVPSTIVVGYVLVVLIEEIVHAPLPGKIALRGGALLPWFSVQYRAMWRPITATLLIILVYNSYLWAQTYGLGRDDGYIKTMRYITAHIPTGTTIVTSDDVAVYLLPATYNIRLDRDEQVITRAHTCYFIMSSKDAAGQYDAMTPDFYEWIMEGTYPLFEQSGSSFGEIGLYKGPCKA